MLLLNLCRVVLFNFFFFSAYEPTDEQTTQAMSVIQKLYPSVELRLKDYIAHPKQNGYQSLHATQLVPDNSASDGPPVVIEFQVLEHKTVGW